MALRFRYTYKEFFIAVSTIFLFLLLFGQRLGIPLSQSGLSVALPLMYGYMAILLCFKMVKVNLVRLMLFLAASSSVVVASILTLNSGSLSSLCYLIAVYFPFIFIFNYRDDISYRKIVKVYQALMVFVAVIGIGQYLIQVVGIKYLDPLSLLPEQLLLHGFNTSYPIKHGAQIYKSNAYFLLEPSIFSQLTALSIIIEAYFFRRFWYFLFFTVGLIVSFSGTGIILLAFGLLFTRQMRKGPLLLLILCLPAVFLLMPGDYSNVIRSRSMEIAIPGSSGYSKFVAPFIAVYQVLSSNANTVFFGLGAGSVDKIDVQFLTSYAPVQKLLIEYGLIAGFTFTLFLLFCFINKNRSSTLTYCFLFTYFLLSGSLLQPQTVYIIYVLSIALPISKKYQTSKIILEPDRQKLLIETPSLSA